eukprot:g26048.t1
MLTVSRPHQHRRGAGGNPFLPPHQEPSRNTSEFPIGLGYQEFSYSGGTQSAASIILRPKDYGTDVWTFECDDDHRERARVDVVGDTYFSKYYVPDGRNKSNSTNATTKVSIDYDAKRKKAVLEFAFNHFFSPQCADGEMLEPQKEEGDRACIPIPEMFKNSLPPSVTAGLPASSLPPDCPRLNVSKGSCAQPQIGEYCVWSWLSAKCDGNLPPGRLWDDGCNSEMSTYEIMCETWGLFDKGHPVQNCKAFNLCGTSENCLVLYGSFIMTVNAGTNLPDDFWLMQDHLSSTFQTISGGLLIAELYPSFEMVEPFWDVKLIPNQTNVCPGIGRVQRPVPFGMVWGSTGAR